MTELFYDFPAQVKPDPGSLFIFAAVIAGITFVENTGEVLLCYPDTGIFNDY